MESGYEIHRQQILKTAFDRWACPNLPPPGIDMDEPVSNLTAVCIMYNLRKLDVNGV